MTGPEARRLLNRVDVHRNRLGVVRWTLWGDDERSWVRAIGFAFRRAQARRAIQDMNECGDMYDDICICGKPAHHRGRHDCAGCPQTWGLPIGEKWMTAVRHWHLRRRHKSSLPVGRNGWRRIPPPPQNRATNPNVTVDWYWRSRP